MANNEEFIKQAFQSGLNEDQVRAALAERNKGQTQVQPKQKKSGVLQGLGTILDLPSSAVGGAIKAGGEVARDQFQPPDIGKDFPIGKRQDFNIGELIPPTFVGAARGVKSAFGGPDNRQTVMTELPTAIGVDPSTPAGMGIGLAGEIATPDVLDIIKFGDIAKTAFGKVGGPIKEWGEKKLVQALKASPSQLTKFKQKTGKDIAKFMTENKIVGNFVETATSKIDELQSSFDDLAINSGKKVTSDLLEKSFGSRVKEFSGSVLKELQSKGADIASVKDEILQKFGKNVDVSELTDIRKQIDSLLSEGQFGMPPSQARYLRSVRDALQESIQKATKDLGNLKKIGLDLRDHISFKKIAEKQANKGRGANPIGLLKSLGANVGANVGGVPGAVAGYVASAASKSSAFLGTVSRGLQMLGEGIQESKFGPKILEGLLRGSKEGLLTPTRQQ